jgi:G3E family GTPase
MFQTEKADVIVLNKCDLIDGKIDMKHLEEIVLAFNPQSSIQQTTFGQVPLQSILGVAKGESVAVSGVVDDHRGFVSVAIQAIPQVDEDCTNPGCMGTSHTHTHSHHYHDTKPAFKPSHPHSHNKEICMHWSQLQ